MHLLIANKLPVVVGNNAEGQYILRCTDGHVMHLRSACMQNGDNVNRTLSIQRKSKGDGLICYFATETCAQWVYMGSPSDVSDPQLVNNSGAWIYPGELLKFVFAAGGASAGGTCEVSFVIEDYTLKELGIEVVKERTS